MICVYCVSHAPALLILEIEGYENAGPLLLFFLVTPLQYYLVAIEWYGLFSILIPVYAFLLLPVRSAAAGDCTNFLARTSEIQWGLMICVYCVSHAPALLILESHTPARN